MKECTAVLIGAGQRGAHAYASYALSHPDELRFIAVAEPDAERRRIFKEQHNISDDMCFSSWEELLNKPKLADAMLICTQDRMHFHPTIKALEKGYHVLLEKPMSPDPKECITMGEYATKYNRAFLICHVLRYTPFFSTLKQLLDSKRIGELVSIQHNENVGYWHQAHSFVRGHWRNSIESSPMILAKCCHDMDILLWLADAECTYISSFGSLSHFKKENAPAGAPKRCLDGCPVAEECQYYAPNQYLGENTEWPTASISNDLSIEARTRALKEGPYGRCVYHCDNDVVDHQVVNIEFANEVTAAFTMSAFTKDCTRTMKLMGTRGEIRGAMEKNEIEVIDFLTGEKEVISVEHTQDAHGGGDEGLMRNFVSLVRSNGTCTGLTSADISVQSHIMAFAAEKARVDKAVIDIKEFVEKMKL